MEGNPILEQEIELNAVRKLEFLGHSDLERFKPQLWIYIIKIEGIIQEYKNNQEKFLDEYKNNTISISKVVKDLGISRQTIYNNEILEKYITLSKDIQLKTDLFQKEKNRISRIKELEEAFENFNRKNLELEKLRVENKVLSQNYKDLILKYEKIVSDNFQGQPNSNDKMRKQKQKVTEIYPKRS